MRGGRQGSRRGDELIGEPSLIVLGRPSPIVHEGEVGPFVGESPDDVAGTARGEIGPDVAVVGTSYALYRP